MNANVRRIGLVPTALLMLVALACAGVIAINSVAASKTMYESSQRSAQMTLDRYQVDLCGQRFIAGIDQTLYLASQYDLDAHSMVSVELPSIAFEAQAEGDPLGTAAEDERVRVSANIDGEDVVAIVQLPGSRRIDIRVRIYDDYSYAITQWKATSDTDNGGYGITLWTPEG